VTPPAVKPVSRPVIDGDRIGRRAPLRRTSRRTAGIPDDVRERLFVRTQGRCEAPAIAAARGCDLHGQCFRTAHDPHHLLRSRDGGPDTLDNLLAVCRQCHAWIHDDLPRAARYGLAAPVYADRADALAAIDRARIGEAG